MTIQKKKIENSALDGILYCPVQTTLMCRGDTFLEIIRIKYIGFDTHMWCPYFSLFLYLFLCYIIHIIQYSKSLSSRPVKLNPWNVVGSVSHYIVIHYCNWYCTRERILLGECIFKLTTVQWFSTHKRHYIFYENVIDHACGN